MARKRKKRRPIQTDPGKPVERRPAPDIRAVERRKHREEARRRRDAAHRTARRRKLIGRGVTVGIVLGAVALGATYVVNQERERHRLEKEASELASAAGCTDVKDVPSDGGGHLPVGETTSYPKHPPTSGIHDLSPLPPDPAVYTDPVPEQNAVHNLEHGYVLLYYRAGGDDALKHNVVAALSDLAEGESKVILAPYSDLGPDTALALAAWNRLQGCPSTVTAAQALGLAESFLERLRGGGEAPEASVP